MGFRAPVFKELYLRFENASAGYVVAGNSELQPESSQAANLGVEYRPANWIWLSVSLFHNAIENLIFPRAVDAGGAGVAQRFAYVNVASAYTQGMELSARLRIVEGLSVEAGYALIHAYDEENERPLEGRAMHRGSLNLRYRHPSWGFEAAIRSSVFGERPFYEESGEEYETTIAEPYATVDIRIAQRLWEHLTLFIGAENLLDAGHPEHLPMQPRSFYGGIGGNL